jgi:hypothetical protein
MLFTLYRKHTELIANCIAIFLMDFGTIKILQCDNGKEFKGTSLKLYMYLKILLYINALLILLRRYGIKFTHGDPRTPYIQGLVEQANGTVENKIQA